ncbi:MAG: DapH/DapD/GlmU-related protein [Coleofasciculaceae cyanobacterium]
MNNKENSKSPSRLSRWKESVAITLVGWVPLLVGKQLRKLVYSSIFGRIGSQVTIDPGVEFKQVGGIELSDRVWLESYVRIKCGGYSSKIRLGERVHFERGVDLRSHRHGDIEIGADTYVGPYTCLSGEKIQIGKYCLIASHCSIYANNHNFSDPTREIKQQENTYEGIVIEDGCWLGTGARVLDGVTIGRGSVIGAGAVVTKDIPPYSIAVGVPARVVSQRKVDPETLLEARAAYVGGTIESI